MKFLVDTNIFLSARLLQGNWKASQQFFKTTPASDIALSIFSYNSIGIILSHRQRLHLFEHFSDDLLQSGAQCLSLNFIDAQDLIMNIQQWHLDFDDAYQYTVAKKHQLQLVSFDKDFDKTDLKRLEP
jgi:predicted nucleic acid-binding protein